MYKTSLEHMILQRAGNILEALACQNQLDACAWQALTRVVRDAQNTVITPVTITYCCEVVGQFIERATAEQLSGDSSVLLCTTLRKIITTCDSAHAKYALSRLLFVIDHVGREETGIKSNEGSAFDEAFKYAAAAHKAGLVEAAPFVKALMLYRGIQGLYAQKKDADAVDRVFDLMAIELPHKEKKLCDAFAHDSLRISGATGVARARAWRIAQLLDSAYAQDNELALKMVCEVFGECMSLDFDAEPNETWHNKLRYYKEYKVVEKIGALYKVLTHEHVLAQSEYVLAIVSLLRALTTYQLLESSEQPAKELLLQTAVVLANKAYDRAKKCKKGNDAFVTQTRLVAGACSFLIGRFYIHQKNMEQANLAIEVGAKLQNPQCMRMLAVKALDTATPTKKMTQQEFDGHIATLHTAFEHGDLYAGELLAEHYFDGPQNSFVCGYWLPIDTQRAYNIALKVGVKSGQACRIIGYFDFCRALIDSKKKDTTGVVTNSIQLLMQAVQLECEQAYAHLLDMCTSPECTAEHKRSIVTFLEQKAAEKVPVGLCAMGSLLLSNPQRNPEYVDQAISYFNEAARLSEDQFGHYELIELYTSDPEKYMQETDIFKVYEHCMALLNTTIDIRNFGSQSLDYFGKVIAALHSFKGSDEDQQVAQRYFKNLVGRLRDVGVDVAHKDFTHEEFNKVVTSMGASSVIAVVPMSGGITGNMEVSQEQRRAIEIPEDPRERLTYYKDVLIPTMRAELDELDGVYKEVAPIARSPQALALLATQCLYALACNGCVPAVEQYVDMFIESSNKKEQRAALEALYRCMPVLETFDAKTMQECGIFSVYQKHIAFVKHLADVTHNGHAALVVAFWYSLCNTLNIECDNQEQNKAMRYCKIAAQAGCTGGIYLWNKHQLLRGGPLSKAEFSKVLQALVDIKDQELSAAELLMELYAGRGKLPCGHTVAVNKKYAKKIALQIKDKSVPALQRLVIMAQEDKEFKKAILYKLEIVKRKRVLDRMAFVELAQNCAVAHIYPDEIVEYLEGKVQEGYSDARHPLGGLMAKRKQFDRAIELLNQVIEEGGQYTGHAHLEMAFVCIDQDWCGFSLQKALEHVEMGIRAIAVDQCNRPSGTECVQTFAMEIIKLMFDALKTQKLALKQEAGDVLQRVTDLMQGHQYYNAQSVEWPLIFATVHCLIGSDYWLLRRYFVSALQMLQDSKAREVDLEYIGNAVSIVLSKLQVDVLAAQKEGNSKRAEQLRANMQDLLGLIKKDKVIYYIIFPVEIEAK